MLTFALFIPLSFAATVDTMLGYTLGQPISTLPMEKVPQGAYATTANVAGEEGRLFLVPCGAVIHEIIFQVIVFPAATDGGAVIPAARYAVNTRQAASDMRQKFEGALFAAGWTAVAGGDATGTVLLRDGVYRSTSTACEPYDATTPASGETCRASIHAGGLDVCTAGL